MALTVMWACAVLLMLNFQLYQTHDIQKVTGRTKSSGDSMIVHLMSFVVKHAEKIKDLEHKQEKQQEKHDDQLKNAMSQLEEKHDKELKKAMSQLEEKHDEELKKMDEKNAEKLLDLKVHLQQQQKKNADEIEILKGSLSTKEPITLVVGFHVALDHSQASGGKVAFNRILSNYGNGWNSITHTFIVPTKGLYFLTMSIANEGGHAWAYLRRGSKNLQAVHGQGGHRHNSETASTVLILDAGEHIYAQHGRGTLYSDSNLYTQLAGFLIRKTN